MPAGLYADAAEDAAAQALIEWFPPHQLATLVVLGGQLTVRYAHELKHLGVRDRVRAIGLLGEEVFQDVAARGEDEDETDPWPDNAAFLADEMAHESGLAVAAWRGHGGKSAAGQIRDAASSMRELARALALADPRSRQAQDLRYLAANLGESLAYSGLKDNAHEIAVDEIASVLESGADLIQRAVSARQPPVAPSGADPAQLSGIAVDSDSSQVISRAAMTSLSQPAPGEPPSAAQLAALVEAATERLREIVSSGPLSAEDAISVAGSLRAALNHIGETLSPAVSDALPAAAKHMDVAAARSLGAAHLIGLAEPAVSASRPAGRRPVDFPGDVKDGLAARGATAARPASGKPQQAPAPLKGATPR
jgi:hypothetical protein